ncbi:MAG: ATP/GTP-binding protein [Sedimentibacter sp.]
MLIQFNFKNFKSFKDEVSLDLTATKITEHNDHVMEVANDKLLKVAAIYGANASGKSNIYEAFEFMSYYVLESFKFGGDAGNKKKTEYRYTKVTPFLFNSKSKDQESTFEVFFTDGLDSKQKSYQYGFSINQEEILEEWLFYKTKTSREYRTLFYRKGREIDFVGITKSSADNIKVALEKETLIVSLGAKLKVTKLKLVRDWFINNEIVNYGSPEENLYRSFMLPHNFTNDKNVQNKVIKFFNSFDDSIKGFNVEKVNDDVEKADEQYRIDTVHKMNDTSEIVSIPLDSESSGTLKMFSIFPSIQEVFDIGSVLFVDELNSRLHPLLVRNIILSFLDPTINTKNAQLIFTTHDIWQLSNDLLRRDEIWFVEKDSDGISSLYSLSDFTDDNGAKIRKDENYTKNYLTGKYGAIPRLKSFDIFKEE